MTPSPTSRSSATSDMLTRVGAAAALCISVITMLTAPARTVHGDLKGSIEELGRTIETGRANDRNDLKGSIEELGRTFETGRANDRREVMQLVAESESRTAAHVRQQVADSEARTAALIRQSEERLQRSLDKLLERH